MSNKETLHTFKFHALGGGNEIQLYHIQKTAAEKILATLIREIKAIEEKYSRYKDESIISKINKSAGIDAVETDEETAAMLDYSEACFKESGGLFDITSGILRRAWDFKEKRIPSQAEINDLLPLIGWDKVEWKRPFIFLKKKGMEIDFGGIGKEYAVDKAAGILNSLGIKSALINLGGDIRILGPQPDGKAWDIGIQHPRKTDSAISSIAVIQGAVTTSGDYERYIEIGGKRYCHILNPMTGYPAVGFQSVTLIAESCLVAGSICTIAMLKGKKEGLEFLKESRRKFVAITEDGEIRYFTPPT
jgi:thiamine biosynthesis lipoprotein